MAKMSSRNLVITIVIVVVILLVGWWLIQTQQTTAPTPSPTQTTQTVTPTATESSPSAMVGEASITISSTGFSPKDVTIKAGESVTWTNSDSVNHIVNSAPHPVHTDYQPLNTVGLLKASDKKSLTFPEAGTYKYHDHLNPTLFGSVTVE